MNEGRPGGRSRARSLSQLQAEGRFMRGSMLISRGGKALVWFGGVQGPGAGVSGKGVFSRAPGETDSRNACASFPGMFCVISPGTQSTSLRSPKHTRILCPETRCQCQPLKSRLSCRSRCPSQWPQLSLLPVPSEGRASRRSSPRSCGVRPRARSALRSGKPCASPDPDAGSGMR